MNYCRVCHYALAANRKRVTSCHHSLSLSLSLYEHACARSVGCGMCGERALEESAASATTTCLGEAVEE